MPEPVKEVVKKNEWPKILFIEGDNNVIKVFFAHNDRQKTDTLVRIRYFPGQCCYRIITGLAYNEQRKEILQAIINVNAHNIDTTDMEVYSAGALIATEISERWPMLVELGFTPMGDIQRNPNSGNRIQSFKYTLT